VSKNLIEWLKQTGNKKVCRSRLFLFGTTEIDSAV